MVGLAAKLGSRYLEPKRCSLCENPPDSFWSSLQNSFRNSVQNSVWSSCQNASAALLELFFRVLSRTVPRTHISIRCTRYGNKMYTCIGIFLFTYFCSHIYVHIFMLAYFGLARFSVFSMTSISALSIVDVGFCVVCYENCDMSRIRNLTKLGPARWRCV